MAGVGELQRSERGARMVSDPMSVMDDDVVQADTTNANWQGFGPIPNREQQGLFPIDNHMRDQSETDACECFFLLSIQPRLRGIILPSARKGIQASAGRDAV